MTKNEAFYINLGSMTTAVRAKEALEKNGYKSTVGKTGTASGCSWGVWVKEATRAEVIDFIRREGIHV